MRILLVISDLEYGGTQRQVLALANALNSTPGIDVHICTLSDYVPLAKGLLDAERRLHIFKKKHKYDVTVAWRIARLIKRIGVNVVHCFLFDAEILGRTAATLSGVPVVVGSERCSVGSMSWKKRIGLKLTDRFAHAIIANSRAGKDRYIRDVGTDPDRIFVVYNGVDTQRFRPLNASALRRELGLPADDKVVGMFASFKAHKNYEMYVRTAHWVLSRRTDVWFLAVGAKLMDGYDGSDERYRRLTTLVGELGLGERFLFVGNRSDVEMAYNACDITVLTSYYEGTPNVLLESMACGVPVVATDVSDNSVIVQHNRTGFLVGDDDDQTCGDRLVELLGDDVMRKKMGDQARLDMVERFSLQALGENTASVYLRHLATGAQDTLGGTRA